MNQTTAKTDRINLRLQHSAKMVLERAAGFEGQSVSHFIITSALEHAEQTIHEHELMRLNAKESEAFMDALSKPIHFNDKLTAALEEHQHRVISQ